MKVVINRLPGGGYFWEVQLDHESQWGYTFTNRGALRSSGRAARRLGQH